jgi:hypothetical protein
MKVTTLRLTKRDLKSSRVRTMISQILASGQSLRLEKP